MEPRTIPAAETLPLDSVATCNTYIALRSPLIFAVVVLRVEILAVFPFTVEVKLLILFVNAVSAFALVVASVDIAEVLLLTVEVRFDIAVVFAEVSVVKVTISDCAVDIFVLFVVTVELNVLYKLIREESLVFSHPLFDAFLT